MIVMNHKQKPEQKIETYPYKGKPYKVKGATVRWLAQAGIDGSVEYGFRHFTLAPGGEVPIHIHAYYQTMFILTGKVMCRKHDFKTDNVVEEACAAPGDFVHFQTMEVHSLMNPSDTEPATFLCCVGITDE